MVPLSSEKSTLTDDTQEREGSAVKMNQNVFIALSGGKLFPLKNYNSHNVLKLSIQHFVVEGFWFIFSRAVCSGVGRKLGHKHINSSVSVQSLTETMCRTKSWS